MLAQVKKLAGGDLAGRLGAWWNGRDYVAPTPEGAGEAPPVQESAAAQPAPAAKAKVAAPEPEPVPAATPPKPDAKVESGPQLNGAEVRIRALETLWGEGRLAPGSFALDTRIVDGLLELADKPGDVGFVGGDPALIKAFAAQSERRVLVSEWRAACATAITQACPAASVAVGEVDRPRGFQDGSLQAIASVEAFAFADHKAGLVARMFRALDGGGRWVFLDTTRRTKKTPPEAFASAWAEPQLATNDEIEELLKLAGFKTVRRMSANELVLAAARSGYSNLSRTIEGAASNGLTGREGALFLQELAWEAQSWRARTRAIEGGALEMNLWVADKTEQVGPLKFALNEVVAPDDAGAADTLFDSV